jgi:hypothetical protein
MPRAVDQCAAQIHAMAGAQLPTRNAADILLHKMTKAGEIERVKRCVYGLHG